MTKPWTALFLLAAIAGVSCNGQTGGEVGAEDGTGGAGSLNEGDLCDESATPLALAEVSPLGFSAEEVLAFAGGTHEASLTYDPEQRGQFTLTPDAEGTDLTLVIEALGAAEFIDAERAEAGSGLDIDAQCPDRVSIPVRVTVSTTDGAFAEDLEGTLTAYGPAQATLSVPLDLGALAGSFAVEVLEPSGGEPVQTELTATLGDGLFVGEVGGTIELIGDEVAQASGATYAEWGYAGCEAGYAPVAADAALTPALLLEQVNAASPLALTWSDGSATELTLAATAPSPVLCRELDDPQSGEPPAERYVLSAEAALATSDGRLGTTQPITLTALADAGTLATLTAGLAGAPPVAPSEFEATYGLSGVDLGDFTDLFPALAVEYAMASAGTTVTGTLTVFGQPPSDCVDTPNSSCGSPGSQAIEVATIATP